MLHGELLIDFNKNFWRRTPRVFRQAIDVSAYPLEIDSLCKMTLSDMVESRMVNTNQELLLGPFDKSDFPSEFVPKDHLLLIQCLEQHLHTAALLLREQFKFIPSWQVDDVMSSIGDTGANCGAHFDQYDVFLLQHHGKKRWHLDEGGHIESDLDNNEEIRVLKDFNPKESFDLTAGDVLYLPPGIGHLGICDGLSMTLSIGIRNPTQADLLADLSEFVLEDLSSNITMNNRLHSIESGLPTYIAEELSNDVSHLFNIETLQRWYGCYVTRLRDSDLLRQNNEKEYKDSINFATALPTRMTYARINQKFFFYVNGDVFELNNEDEDWVRTLCNSREFKKTDRISTDGKDCLSLLLKTGALV